MANQKIEYSDEVAEAMLSLLPKRHQQGYCKKCKVEVPARVDGKPRKVCHLCHGRLRFARKEPTRSREFCRRPDRRIVRKALGDA